MKEVLLDGKVVDPGVINPSKHRFIGTFRPPVQPDASYVDENGARKMADIVLCGCGEHLWTREGVGEHYRMGHFDTPQYVTIDGVCKETA